MFELKQSIVEYVILINLTLYCMPLVNNQKRGCDHAADRLTQTLLLHRKREGSSIHFQNEERSKVLIVILSLSCNSMESL